jgi:hypothetical protein
MSTCSRSLLKPVLHLAVVILMMNAAQARAYVGLTLVDVRPWGTNFRYTYAVTLTAGSMLTAAGGGPNNGFSPTNNFYTIYDVRGLVPGSVTYGGALGIVGLSTHQEMLLGDDAPGETPIPADNGNILNITTYWTGPDVAAPSWFDIPLGTLSFVSTNPLGVDWLAYTAATQELQDFPDVPANTFSLVAGPGEPTPAPATTLPLGEGGSTTLQQPNHQPPK